MQFSAEMNASTLKRGDYKDKKGETWKRLLHLLNNFASLIRKDIASQFYEIDIACIHLCWMTEYKVLNL